VTARTQAGLGVIPTHINESMEIYRKPLEKEAALLRLSRLYYCHPDTLARVQRIFREAGYSVAVNYPYAGGFVTSHYGRPDSGLEAIQIEVNRDLYLNPITLAPKRGYEDLARDFDAILKRIIQFKRPLSQAAQ